MKTVFSKHSLKNQTDIPWIIFLEKGSSQVAGLSQKANQFLGRWIKKNKFEAEFGEVATLDTLETLEASHLVLVGLGASKEYHNKRLEKAASSAARSLRKINSSSVAVLSQPPSICETTPEHYIQLVVRGLVWGNYKFDKFKSEQKKSALKRIVFANAGRGVSKLRKSAREAVVVGDALLKTADLANLPGNEASPEKIAAYLRKMASETGLSCSIMGEKALRQKGCNAIRAVGQGSSHEPRMITLKYPGTNKNAKPLVLVGKAVTFDSGGISIKPSKKMSWMKYDKCGGMAVVAVMRMLKALKVSTPVVGIVAAVENMPGGNAIKPGDIVSACSGKSIEIINTDAEGRLALADALTLAEKENPSAIIDLATLTGACVVALGHHAAAVLGNCGELTEKLVAAGKESGDRIWELPLWPEYAKAVESSFADIKNTGDGTAGTISAAAFLENFVSEKTPWAHFDIAGTAWTEKSAGDMDVGATIFGARLLIDYIRGI